MKVRAYAGRSTEVKVSKGMAIIDNPDNFTVHIEEMDKVGGIKGVTIHTCLKLKFFITRSDGWEVVIGTLGYPYNDRILIVTRFRRRADGSLDSNIPRQYLTIDNEWKEWKEFGEGDLLPNDALKISFPALVSAEKEKVKV